MKIYNTYSNPSRTVLAALLLLMFASCTKDFEKINSPYRDVTVSTASPLALFNQLSRRATEDAYPLYTGLFMPITNQQGVQNTPITIPNYISAYWNNYYQDLADYKLLVKLVGQSGDPSVYTNLKSIATILIASKTLSMLDRYGKIPYFNAAIADEGIPYRQPEYDDEAAIYKSVLDDLSKAINAIPATGNQIALGNNESFLGSNFASWQKFGNALLLRYAVRLYNKETALASSIITDILGNNKPLPDAKTYTNMESMRQNNYGNYPQLIVQTPNNADKLWYAFREQSVSNIRLSSNVWKQISATTSDNGSGIFDPRTYVWFMPNNAGKWVPQPQDNTVSDGSSTLYPNQATPAAPNTLPDNKFAGFNFYLVRDFLSLPYIIISEADVHLLKAEIYARGMGVAKNFTKASQAYNDGLTASVNFWYTYVATSSSGIWPSSKPTLGATALATFLAHPQVALVPGDDENNIKKIITQAWLTALWEQPEAWAIVRRTGSTPKDPNYTPDLIYNKLPYPESEAINNKENYLKATNGANYETQANTKVYWAP